MKQVIIKQVPEHDEKVSIYTCDSCGKQVIDTQWGNLKQCIMCKKDVCKECAIKTDLCHLEDDSYDCDYPDYYCPKCWELDKESKLWGEWHLKVHLERL